MPQDTKRPENKCLDCRNTWFPRGKDLSDKCPSCGSRHVGMVIDAPTTRQGNRVIN